MRIASRMAITQFIGRQAVVLAGASVLDDAASHASPVDRVHGDDRNLDRLAASGDVRP